VFAGSSVLGCLTAGCSGLIGGGGGLCVAARGRVRITGWPVPALVSAGASIPQASYIRCFIFSMASGERDSFS
jgi:hypothetical protein